MWKSSISKDVALTEPTNHVDDAENEILKQLVNANNVLQDHREKIRVAKKKCNENEKNAKSVHVEDIQKTLEAIEACKRVCNELLEQKDEFESTLQMFLHEKEAMLLQHRKAPWQSFIKNISIEIQRLKSSLPIYAKKTSIVNLIENHQVVILTAETGSGKSTQVVQYLYQSGFSKDGLIVCTQPRKVAALSLAMRVSEELLCTVGTTVGYSVGMEMKMSKSAAVIYMTDRMLLNECVQDPLLKRYKCVIIDEAHERSIATDLLLAMIKQALKIRPELRVVISSATIDPTIFQTYFGDRARRLHIHGRTFPVTIHWLNEYERKDYFVACVETAKEVLLNKPPGDILVFLTTPAETEKAQELIKNDKSIPESNCLVLHGQLKSNKQQAVFETSEGKRKIVFATNSAETSITIPNITYVVDCGVVKEKCYDSKKNVSMLRIGPISKSSAEQRMGRAGRTHEGECYRIYTKEEFKTMKDIALPEILRENLGIALLKLFQLGIRDPLNYDFVEPPPKQALKTALSDLQELGAVAESTLTADGRVMAALSVEPRLGKFITLGCANGIAMEAVVVAAICSIGGNVFFRSGTEEEKQISDLLKVKFCNKHGDIVTLLEAYKEWNGVPDRAKNKWCVENSMNAKTLRLTKDLIKDLTGHLEREMNEKVSLKFKESDVDSVHKLVSYLLARCFSKNTAFFSGHERGGYYTKGSDINFLHPSSSLSYLGITPKWLLYETILITNRPYLLNVSALPAELYQHGVTEYDQTVVVEKVYEKIIGKNTAQRYGFGKNYGSSLEQLLKQKFKCNVFIDYDERNGLSELYAPPLHKSCIINYFDFMIEKEVKKHKIRVLDAPISSNNPYRIVIGAGAEMKEFLDAGKYISILVSFQNRKESADDNTIEETFSKYGDISDIIKFKPGCHYWGKFTYTKSSSAKSACMNHQRKHERNADTNNSDDDETSIVAKPDFQKQQVKFTVSQDFVMEAVWTRRRLKGHAFLIVTDASKLSIGAVGPDIFIKHNKKNLGEFFVDIKNLHYSDQQIRGAIMAQFPGLEIIKCVVPRESMHMESQDFLAQMYRQLVMKINLELQHDQQNQQPKFFVKLFPPRKETDTYYKAEIIFRHVTDGHKMINKIIIVRNAMVKLTAKLHFTVHINSNIFELLKERITAIQASMEKSNMTIEKKNWNSGVVYVISVKCTTADELSAARVNIQEIIKGTEVECSNTEFRFFFTPCGKTFLNDLAKPNNAVSNQCIITLDRRRKLIVIQGLPEIREQVVTKINDIKRTIKTDEVELDIPLNRGDVPKGFIKHFLSKFGQNFEVLYKESKVTYITVNFFRHYVKIFGELENVRNCHKMILAFHNEQRTGESLIQEDHMTCPICFDNIGINCHILQVCSHAYCKECILGMCDHAIKNNDLPIRCASEGCEENICITDITGFVKNEDMVKASISQFVLKYKQDYGYCLTPNCEMIYHKSHDPNPVPFQCPLCQMFICTYCQKEHHTNISCEFQNRFEDESLKIWLSEKGKDRGICPNCSAPIERIDGCLHVTCAACKKHICWRCKKAVFDTGDKCYNHLGLCSG